MRDRVLPQAFTASSRDSTRCTMLDPPPGADTKEVQRTMEHEIIEEAELMGTYEKKTPARVAS